MEGTGNDTPLDQGQLGALCSLEDSTRLRLYTYVAEAGEPVTRDQAAAALDIDRSLAAYHLDKLANEGLLVPSFARPEGRGGPGAGRPAKHYARADREFAVSLPPRDYRLAAELFARAAAADATGTVRGALEQAATRMGRELAADGADLHDQLRQQGFAPYDDGDTVWLRNCPFHQLAREHTALVCGMNLALLTGMTEALNTEVNPRLDPGPDRCCVTLET
ncbi:ArsR family transcriptional regulator [Egibacter rhizosphaerae]|uniref:ArsR family transcriptional regulator n=1 Tax=Egibacter rhizosphaerae TaxID=1670831 RepID=A0A411YD99_9ACTN|nr:helix-turn-helix domain-containing protein [Egibacter rhizosphaerae]QBI19158.1 ArsR family transcriptional regulator [Egibacter rhizosphaerae]